MTQPRTNPLSISYPTMQLSIRIHTVTGVEARVIIAKISLVRYMSSVVLLHYAFPAFPT